ncbi:MAG: hypothetical protein ABIP45_08895 [Knoellia sp.]
MTLPESATVPAPKAWYAVSVQLGDGRVLHCGRGRWLRALA